MICLFVCVFNRREKSKIELSIERMIQLHNNSHSNTSNPSHSNPSHSNSVMSDNNSQNAIPIQQKQSNASSDANSYVYLWIKQSDLIANYNTDTATDTYATDTANNESNNHSQSAFSIGLYTSLHFTTFCLSVCMSVCPFVCLFVCSFVHFI